jgi:uncharacterized membrane protein
MPLISIERGGKGMSILLLIGILGVLSVIFLKNPLVNTIKTNNQLVLKLNHSTWFQNYWLAGIFLFLINAVLFSLTFLVLYALMFLVIPYIHLLVMFLAVIASVFFWLIMNKAWRGTKIDRFKMGFVGSSFYMILTIIFSYMLVTLEPAYPGEDTFMRFIGIVFAIIVAVVAFVTCLVMTGFTRENPL